MGRFFKNHMLEFSIGLTLVGLILTGLAWTMAYSETAAIDFWRDGIRGISDALGDEGDWNIVFMIAGPIVLITGAWYLGEQLVTRRRFQRLLDGSGKKSEFVRNKRDLEKLARDLPDDFRERIKEKEANLKSAR